MLSESGYVEPHLYERIKNNDSRVSKAVYRKRIGNILKIAEDKGYVIDRETGCLSYQYVGNLNVSDIVARTETEVVFGRTQRDDFKQRTKVLTITSLIKASNPAFVVTSPSVFNVLMRQFNLNLLSEQKFKKLRGEVYIGNASLPQTVFIRLPLHVSK
ncbi:hypothetical protein [Peribacillus butanolivorans]|uniref:hypothetical protein n=1 Tax=Peribacillus butanolivorans TaxID=421767 RepID=UPI003670AB55